LENDCIGDDVESSRLIGEEPEEKKTNENINDFGSEKHCNYAILIYSSSNNYNIEHETKCYTITWAVTEAETRAITARVVD
jgi:hypothetical protein